MTNSEQNSVSPLRLRIGVLFIFLWWAPFWMLAPAIADAIGSDDTGRVTFAIMAIQTVIGLLGMVIAGRQAKLLIKGLPFKKVPGTIWHTLIHGNLKESV